MVLQVPKGARSVSKGPRAAAGKRPSEGLDTGEAPAGKRARSGAPPNTEAKVHHSRVSQVWFLVQWQWARITPPACVEAKCSSMCLTAGSLEGE